MYTKYPTDYEIAVQCSLHPKTAEEKRLADAYLVMEQLIRENQDNCVYCGSPSTD